mmetsp:Transcript_28424/g.32870  ORF Transcript_28424/g.32870 Transcript_28424/m.32870 type:complete len:346 (+) Transcript_28424:58-1095(+)
MMHRTSCYRMHLFRRVVVRKHGGPEVLELEDFGAQDIASIGPKDVLVRNSFAGVNYIDTYYRTGLYKKPSMPFVAGEEASGAIVKVGSEVSKSRLGERVAYFQGSRGSYASFTVVRSDDTHAVPSNVSDDVAAAALLQGCTAHYLSHDVFPVQAGQTVLVHAAAGGTGILLTQMCKQRGARVIATCGGDDATKEKAATMFGSVDHLINYTKEKHWVSAVRSIAPAGVDCVFDGIGQATFHSGLDVLRVRGTMVNFGNASGPVSPVAPLLLTEKGSITLQRPSLKHFMRDENREGQRRVADVFQKLAQSELMVHLGKTFSLAQARDAHEYLEGRHSSGKLLLNCQE